MKCLVTGAAGYIGSFLVKRLVTEGHEVTALIHKNKPIDVVEKANYVTADLTQIDSVEPLLKNIDYVFHCAAYVKDYGPKNIFFKINYEATVNLSKACEKAGVKKFVFLSSHINYETYDRANYYSKTKLMAEKYLLEQYKTKKFPVIIIRPGHVFGPGHAMWVVYPIRAIQKNRISLIDNGNRIFSHTYIDNLIDAIILSLKQDKAIGQTIDITDGDNNTTWGDYLNHLARLSGKPGIKRNMSKRTAMLVAKFMMISYKIFRIKPWVTPMSVNIFTNTEKISVSKAKSLIGYVPKVNYDEAMEKIEEWLRREKYIS